MAIFSGVSWCCGNHCWLAIVLWCGYCLLSFVLRRPFGDRRKPKKRPFFSLPRAQANSVFTVSLCATPGHTGKCFTATRANLTIYTGHTGKIFIAWETKLSIVIIVTQAIFSRPHTKFPYVATDELRTEVIWGGWNWDKDYSIEQRAYLYRFLQSSNNFIFLYMYWGTCSAELNSHWKGNFTPLFFR